MEEKLSFSQELRATRLANEKKKGTRSNSAPEPKESERPWQEDIEQVQRTMREVLRAVASFSGVELPGLPSGVQDDPAPAPTLDIKTLKDRFRNELEGFSIKTSKELANRAREQTLAALEAVQNEVGGQLEQVAAGLREQLQLPAQVEKLVQPCLEESAARLEKSFSQKLEHLVAEQEQLVQDRLQSALDSVQAQMTALEQNLHQTREGNADSAGQTSTELNSKISALEQQIHQIRELKADSAAKLSAELNSRVENLFAEHQRSMQEGLRNALSAVQAQMSAQVTAELQAPAQIEKLIEPCVGQATARLEESFVPRVELLINEQDQSAKERLQGALSSVQAQMSVLEQSVQQIRELKTDSAAQTSAQLNAKFEHLLTENEQLIQNRLQSALSSVQAHMSAQLAAQFREQLQAPAQIEKLLEPCVNQAAARLEESFVPKVELLINEQDQSVQDRLQTALSPVYAKMSSLEQNMQRIGELKADSVTQASAEQQNVALGNSISQKVERLLAEQEKSAHSRLQGALSSVQSQLSALEQKLHEVHELKADSVAHASAAQQNAALENSISQKVERLLANQERSVQGSLQGALSSVQGQLSALEQNLREVRELKADSVDHASAEQQNAALESSLSQKIEHLFTEQERLIQGRLQTALSSIQAQMSALEHNLTEVREIKADAAAQPAAEQQNEALENAIFQKVERLFAKQDRLIQGRVQTALDSIQAQMGAVEQKMELMRELKAALVAQMSSHQPPATVDRAMKQAEARLNNGFKEFLDRSFSRIEGSFNSLMESPKFKPVQSTHAKLEALRKSIPDGSTEMLIRVQQALDNLDRLGSKDPLPVS